MNHDNLLSLKDDMIAYIAGHGMRRMPAYADLDIPSVLWDEDNNPDSWKEFVETAKAAGAAFVTISEAKLDRDEIEEVIEQIESMETPEAETGELEEIQSLLTHVGKIGYLQLGFAYQGMMFLHESVTDWYERYQDLLADMEELSELILDDEDEDEEL